MLLTVPSGVTEVVEIESACAVVVESTDVESATAVSDLEPPHADKTAIVATKANANTFFIFNCFKLLLNCFTNIRNFFLNSKYKYEFL